MGGGGVACCGDAPLGFDGGSLYDVRGRHEGVFGVAVDGFLGARVAESAGGLYDFGGGRAVGVVGYDAVHLEHLRLGEDLVLHGVEDDGAGADEGCDGVGEGPHGAGRHGGHLQAPLFEDVQLPLLDALGRLGVLIQVDDLWTLRLVGDLGNITRINYDILCLIK